LKPVVIPSDGGRSGITGIYHAWLESHAGNRYSYLVRMIKPNLITSHDWHVQPIVKDP